MADIRHQPGGSEKMNATDKTSHPHGQLALQFMNFRANESRVTLA